MKVLLDTNIIIHREANKIYRQDIGQLFNWLDKLNHQKFIHPLTIDEIKRHRDKDIVATMEVKIQSYNKIKNPTPLEHTIQDVSSKIDSTENDKNDTQLLNEVYEERVDILISEDKKIHRKAKMLGISDKVFTIQSYLEKVTAENPELVNYKVLAVKKVDFADVDLKDSFFESFREDYSDLTR